MKKLLWLLFLVLPAFGQNFSGFSGGDVFVLPPYRFCLGADNGQGVCMIQVGNQQMKFGGQIDFQLTAKTVSTLPPAAANAGRIYRVTDGQSGSDCTVGGASTSAVCFSNGATWAALAGGSGSPGGSTGQPQFNSTGTFGGVPNSLVDLTTGRWALNNIANSRWVTPSYNWSFAPGGSYTGGVSATLTFNGSAPNNVCPQGVIASDANLFAYISGGTGTAEVVDITGGTCTPGLAGGTLTFTPANSHSGAFTVGSASSGIYEAMKDAGNSNASIYLYPAGTTGGNAALIYPVQATITVPFRNMTIWGNSAILKCNARGPCIKAAASPQSDGLTIYNLSFTSGISPQSATISNLACSSNTATFTVSNGSGQIVTGDTVMIQKTVNSRYWGGPWGPVTANATTVTFTDTGCNVASTPSPGYMIIDSTAVESNVNNPGTHLINIGFNQWGGISGSFANQVVALNDQDFRVIAMNSRGLGNDNVQCQNGTYCGAAIFAPGPFGTNPAVISVSASNLSMNCNGDGIVAWNGNSLNADDNIIQGTSTTGIFTGPIRGGLIGTKIAGLYQENSLACHNPDYPAGNSIAQQGIMDYGRPITLSGTIGTDGAVPVLAGFTSGTQEYWYWIVWKDSGGGVSRPMLAANAFSSTGTGSPVVIWPRVMDLATTTYDVLRTSTATVPTPGACAGGSALACGSVATAQAQCNTLTCSFTDNLATSTSSYAVTNSASTASPTLWFWPGNILLQQGASVNNLQVNAPYAQTPPTNGAVNLNGSDVPVGLPTLASNYGGFRPSHNYESATIIPNSQGLAGRGGNANESLKGRLNIYAGSVGTDEFSDLITLVDSQPEITLTDPANRPLGSANDVGIGVDTNGGLSTSGFSMHSPVSVSGYVNTLMDGTSWVFRGTAGKFAIQGHLNQQASGQFAGSCAMSTSTSCTFSLAASYASTPMCVVSPITATSGSVVAGACSVSGTTVTITAASSNSLTWNAILVGNPN